MAKFVFKLQSFLNIKQKIEEQKRNEYGKAQKKLEEEKRKKEELILIHKHLTDSMREKIMSGIKPVELQQYNNYVAYILKEIQLQQQQIEKAEVIVKQKREEVVQAMKERKILETLKEKKYEQYLDEEKKAEQRIVDEIVSFKYNNKETSY